MRTEDDIRAAFRTLARQAPDADAMLTVVREQLNETNTRPHQDGRRGLRTPIAAVASVVAVLAVIGASVALAVGDHAPHRPASSPTQVPIFQPGPVGTAPPYYLALIHNRTGPYDHAAVADTVSGATLATARPPKPFNNIITVTGAGDDRTFVLAAQRDASGPIALFRARFDPGRRTITLTALPIPEIRPDERLNGLALSSDGSGLAVSTTLGRYQQLSVYSMTSGTAKEWRQPGVAQADMLSWGRGGILAYNWDYSPHPGVWLLNTATAGGGFIANSRLAVTVPHGWAFVEGALLTPDGRTIVAAQIRTPGNLRLHRTNSELAEFSASTGKEIGVLWPRHVGADYLAWTSPSGNVLAVDAPVKNTEVFGGLSGGRLTPIPVPSQGGPFTVYLAGSIAF